MTETRIWRYFGGRLLERTDRLGSVSYNYTNIGYFPYGEEKPADTAQDRDKFATYYRDGSGFDYAMNRHYDSAKGRFTSPDPYQASAGVEHPASWNRYAYVEGDPVNFVDPRGLESISAHHFLMCVLRAPWFQTLGETEAYCNELLGGGPEAKEREGSPDLARGGAPSRASYPECNPSARLDIDLRLDFVANNLSVAASLSANSNMPVDWLLAWSGSETLWGQNNVALRNGNYFGLRAGGNWVNQISCGAGTNGDWACFADFESSAFSALFSVRTEPNSGDRFTVASLLGSPAAWNADPAVFFQLVAEIGQDPGNPDYGTRVARLVGDVNRDLDCLRDHGYLQ